MTTTEEDQAAEIERLSRALAEARGLLVESRAALPYTGYKGLIDRIDAALTTPLGEPGREGS